MTIFTIHIIIVYKFTKKEVEIDANIFNNIKYFQHLPRFTIYASALKQIIQFQVSL